MNKTVLILVFSIFINNIYAQNWGLYNSRTETRDDAGLSGSAGAQSGFFQTSSPVNYPKGAQNWWHLLDVRHAYPGTNWAMQFAGSSVDQNVYFRKVNTDPAQPWSRILTENPDGYAGVGTTSPRTSLDVAGQIYSYSTGFGSSNYTTSSKNWVNFGGNGAGTCMMSSNVYVDGQDKMFTVSTHHNLSGAAIKIPGNAQQYQNSILFYTKPTGPVTKDSAYTGSIAMIISSVNSNVGIGTTIPTEKLSVNGNVRAKKVIVTQSDWPDYVFESSFKLPSLDSIASFIKIKKHLPEMPSAAAIEKDGQDVGEIQKQMLKKIEEMTLYIIEQNNKIEKMQIEIDKLKK